MSDNVIMLEACFRMKMDDDLKNLCKKHELKKIISKAKKSSRDGNLAEKFSDFSTEVWEYAEINNIPFYASDMKKMAKFFKTINSDNILNNLEITYNLLSHYAIHLSLEILFNEATKRLNE